MNKRELREEMIARRLTLSPQEASRAGSAAQEALVGTPAFAAARTVLLYAAFRGEVPADRIAAAALLAGKRLALPRVQKEPRRLWFHAYGGDPGTLERGAYGIAEPAADWPTVAPGEIDLVVVPGVAFDRQGNRLGYGGGYYDRTLVQIRAANPGAALVGLAYGFQIVPALPRDPHDVPVDAVATEGGTYRC